MDEDRSDKPSKKSRLDLVSLKIKPAKIRRRLRKASRLGRQHTRRFVTRRLANLRLAKREIIGWFSVVAIVIAGTALGSSLFANANQILSATDGGTYTEGVVGSISTLNPLYATTAPENAASRLMFSSLYHYDRSGALSPDVASGVQVDKTENHYTVDLRHDVKWSDGENLTADDVLYTVKLIQNPSANVPTSLASSWRDIKIEKVNDYQLKFTLPAYAGFLGALTFPILPEHVLATTAPSDIADSEFSLNPIGSGPFDFKLLQNVDGATGEKAVYMVRNPQYYGVAPRLDRFAIHAYPSSDAIINALQLSEVTAVVDIDSKLASDNVPSNYKVENYSIDDGVFLIFNTAQPALKDVRVRKAVQLALSTAAIRDAAGSGALSLDTPIISAGVQARYHADDRDIAKSQQLLDKAGWKVRGDSRMKGKTPLTLQLKTVNNPQFARIVKVIESELQQVGIKLIVTRFDPSNHSTNFVQSVLQPRDYDLLLYELTIGSDPDQFAYWHSSQRGMDGYNFANYSNPTADAALATARDRIDPALRQAKYATFVKQWLKDVPAVGLFQQSITYAHTKKSLSIDTSAHYVSATDRYNNIANWAVKYAPVYKTP